MATNRSKLSRPVHPMPDFVAKALQRGGLVKEYRERPAYQQNDYIGWITAAKTPEGKQKRLDQMLHELKVGGVYMKMKHNPSRKRQSS